MWKNKCEVLLMLMLPKTSRNIQQTENAAGWVCSEPCWALSPTSFNKAVTELKAIQTIMNILVNVSG